MDSEALAALQLREIKMWEQFLLLGGDPSIATTEQTECEET
jgi:hypothetical protein